MNPKKNNLTNLINYALVWNLCLGSNKPNTGLAILRSVFFSGHLMRCRKKKSHWPKKNFPDRQQYENKCIYNGSQDDFDLKCKPEQNFLL